MIKKTETNSQSAVKSHTIFSLLSILIGILFALVLVELALSIYLPRLQRDSMDPGLIQYHALLGWTLAPDWEGVHRHHDYEATYSTNRAGFRNQDSTPAPATHRVAVLGDSFTFGLGVNNNQTFISVLNKLGNSTSENSVQFENYAIPGTSTDQQLLLFRELPDIGNFEEVLLVVYLANDILDNTLTYPLQAQQGKPLFTLNAGELELTNVPVPLQSKPPALLRQTLGTMLLDGIETQDQSPSFFSTLNISRLVSAFLDNRKYKEDELIPVFEKNLAKGLQLFSSLLDEMNASLESENVRLRVALLPGRSGVISQQGVSHYFQEFLRKEISRILDESDIPEIDLMTFLAQKDRSTLEQLFYPNDGHLTPAGHIDVASQIKAVYDSEFQGK